MITTKTGIHVISRVHKGDGFADCDDDLTLEEKVQVATEIMVTLCNELYRGKAKFYVEDGQGGNP